MIQEYFRLQIRRVNRYLEEFGVHPIFGYLFGVTAFWGGSAYLFYKLSYAPYVYFGLLISTLIWNDRPESIDFFQSIFSAKHYTSVRIVEKISISSPFGIFFLYQGLIIFAFLSLIAAIILPLLTPFHYKGRTLPTPFSHHPFEFAIGIRGSYLLYFGLYFILFMAVRVDNFNLGIATLVVTVVMSITFYSKLESENYIWNFSGSTISFLMHKIIRAIKQALLLSIPIVLILLIMWPLKYLYILGLLVVGSLYLIAFILAKYSAYPRMMSLPQGLILIFCLWIPPLLIFIIPYLFRQSNRKLKCLLT